MPDNLQELLAHYTDDVRQIVNALRDLVADVLTDPVEKVYLGWKTIGYSRDGGMKTSICAIGPHTRHVNLLFHNGTELDDPCDVLEGTGKRTRHVKIRSLDDIRPEILAPLLRQSEAQAQTAA